MARKTKYPEELLDRSAWMVFDSGRPIAHIARDLGIHPETLRKWVRKTEADEGKADSGVAPDRDAGSTPERLGFP